ncbi:GNAT family acetyltransferase [bacterium]|nr:GNAT family acetyltransferase [candidate division CSSED10-310 bacterium]
MSSLVIRQFDVGDSEAVVAMWRECGLVVPWNDPWKDIERKRAVQPELFLIGTVDGVVAASVMAGYEGHRGWINYLAVSRMFQGRGFGRRMMIAAETVLHACGCPKINLQIRSSNIRVMAFYRRLGYTRDDCVSMGKRLVTDG